MKIDFLSSKIKQTFLYLSFKIMEFAEGFLSKQTIFRIVNLESLSSKSKIILSCKNFLFCENENCDLTLEKLKSTV